MFLRLFENVGRPQYAARIIAAQNRKHETGYSAHCVEATERVDRNRDYVTGCEIDRPRTTIHASFKAEAAFMDHEHFGRFVTML